MRVPCSNTFAFILIVFLTLTGCSALYNDALESMYGVRTDVVHVRASGTGDGSSWGDAMGDLQTAIEAAAADPAKTQVWVAAGTYYPSGNPNNFDAMYMDRAFHFSLRNGVAVYGGFDGKSNRFSSRDPGTHVTVLSGDLGTPGVDTDNCIHVFYHPATAALDSTAVLDGCTVTGGNADIPAGGNDQGGGMFNSSSAPTIAHCIFTGNKATRHGGAMYIQGNNDTITAAISSTVFSANIAEAAGALLIIITEDSQVTIDDCSFNNNETSDGNGGALFASIGTTAGSTARLIISGTSFNNNHSYLGGGAISAMVSYSGKMYIQNSCTFTGNYTGTTGSENGGALYYRGENTSSLTVTGAGFAQNEAESSGGAVYIEGIGGATTITGCTFSGNQCDMAGGAVYGQLSNNYSLTINGGSTFTENRTSNDGGALYTSHSGTSWTIITNATFTDNHCLSQGGAVYNYLGNGTYTKIENCSFSGNGINSSDVPVTVEGGAIYNSLEGEGSETKVELTDLTLNGNRATSYGGAICNYAHTGSGPRIDITSCRLENNTAGGYGGGIHNNFTVATELFIEGAHFIGNSGSYGGGMTVYVLAGGAGSAIAINSSVFDSNSAITSGGGIAAWSPGGAAFNFGLVSSVFYGNSSGSEGGGLFTGSSAVSKFVGCTFVDNISPSGGDAHCDTQISCFNLIWGNAVFSGNGGDTPVNPDSVTFININNPIGPDGIWGTDDDGLIPASVSTNVINNGNNLGYQENLYNPTIDLNLNGNNTDTITSFSDLRGRPRANGTVDIGAYEVQ